ncbi:MAG: GNAT family N-acetyltransferase [Acidobacteriota bacterium]|nr:GNAT family N-acetyltransferase [Acidobacteriota bacterium]
MILEGRSVTVEPLDAARHGDSLWPLIGGRENAELWRWMPDGPFPDRESFDAVLRTKSLSEDPRFFAIVDRTSGEAAGHASYMREDRKNRVIEVGGIMYAPKLQRTTQATEAMFLMARFVFEEMRYRRYEWKCNSLNTPSRAAASRLGFTFEGIFRQHMIVKGENRDTAWFSMLDSEWPARKEEFERWLALANFDSEGRQRTSLRHTAA